MEFRILGPVEVREGDRVLPVTGAKQLVLISIFLLHANEAVPTERLIDELWPLEPPAKPADSVQQLVYSIRQTIERDHPRGSILERQGDSYRICVGRDQLDLHRFERLVRTADEAKRNADFEAASWTLREALGIWRGPPLANVSFDPLTATRAEVDRLDELHLTAVVERIEIELEIGHEAELTGELEALIALHPLDERLRRLLMLAFYRAGRQADALSVYKQTRAALLDGLGIEPSRRLQELQQAILRHDAELDPVERSGAKSPTRSGLTRVRTVVAVALEESGVDLLLALAEPLAHSQLARELILAVVVPDEDGLARATALVHERRAALLGSGTEARAAAFTSTSPENDIVRLASREGVDLLLMTCPPEMLEKGAIPSSTAAILANAPCDVGLLVSHAALRLDAPVMVPFGGLQHDWAALEIGSWAANAAGVPLTLVGPRGRPELGERDASRLLADASLLVQEFLGISADPRLVDSGSDGLLGASEQAAMLVVGLPDRWLQKGLGGMRLALARDAHVPVLLVRKGSRPGGLAPPDAATQFNWSLMNEESGALARSTQRFGRTPSATQ